MTPSTNKAIAKEEVQIKKVLQKSIDLFSWQLQEKGMVLKAVIEDAVIKVHPNGIEQAVANLLDNAIRYYEGAGPIEIHGKRGIEYYHIAISGPAQEISAEEQKLLFDRFYRVDHSRARDTGGSGLGLAITKEIIDNHDGKITVQSTQGINTFMIDLKI